MALIKTLLAACISLSTGTDCGNLFYESVGTCRIWGCSTSRGHSHCGTMHKCWCNDGSCPMSSNTGGVGYPWCAGHMEGHSCAIMGCSPEGSFCYRRRCFCGYGTMPSTSNDECVRDPSWPTSLEELYAMNATQQEIDEFLIAKKHSDQMVTMNSLTWPLAAAGLVTFVGVLVLVVKRRKVNAAEGYSQLIAA